MNKKICKLVILMIVLLGVCGVGTGVYAASNNTDNNTQVVAAGDMAKAIDNSEMNQGTVVDAVPAPVVDNTAAQANNNNGSNNNQGIGMIAAALATGLACIGAGIAVAVVASSAIGAISENPGLFGKTVIFAGLAEGIAIYGLIISIMILSKF